MKVHIDVTQEDINLGLRQNPDLCMVQRAFMRCTEGAFEYAHVRTNSIGFGSRPGYHGHGFEYTVPLPSNVTVRIMSWDNKQLISPFSFDLDLPIEEGTNG